MNGRYHMFRLIINERKLNKKRKYCMENKEYINNLFIEEWNWMDQFGYNKVKSFKFLSSDDWWK